MSGWGRGAEVLKQLNAEKDLREKVAWVKAKFVEKYKVTPDAYIRQAIVAAYKTTSEASGFKGRSADGVRHTTNPSPTSSPSPLVVQYHQAEDNGKACARRGDPDGAIKYFDEAVELRESFAASSDTPADPGHVGAVRLLSQRRASLVDLRVALNDSDEGVAKAKLTVTNFYLIDGLVYHC
jgi:hypothetical protein